MKYFLAIFICLFIVTGSQAQINPGIPKPRTLKNFALQGNPLQMTEARYAATLIAKKKKADSLYTSKDTALKMVQETIFVFFENGFLKEQYHTEYDVRKGKVVLATQTRYRYDSLGRLKAVITADKKKNTDSAAFKYDLRNAIIEEQHYDKGKKRTGARQYSYDLKDNLVNIREKNGENMMLGMVRLSYDLLNTLTEIKYFDNMQRYISSETFSYDTVDEKHIQYNKYEFKGEACLGMKGYVMNEYGNHTEETIADSNKRVLDFRTITYNEEQWPVEVKIFAETVEGVETYTYQSDLNHNWIEQNKFTNGVLATMLRREFKYPTDPATEEKP